VKTKLKLPILAAVALLVAVAGCETLISSAARSPRDWQFVQSVGGIALGTPQRDDRGHVLLHMRCNVSGTQTITVHPTAINSALVCEPPSVRVRSGTVFLTIRTTVATNRNSNARCPNADLGALTAGQYSVIYRCPDGSQHPLGSIQIPRQ